MSTLDHSPHSEQLCYVQCRFCDTVLAVSVPCNSLLKTVTVRCGNCTNLLSVNMRGSLLHLPHPIFSPHNLLVQEEIRNTPPPPPINQQQQQHSIVNPNESSMNLMSIRGIHDQLPKPPVPNGPPEKRQRVPSAYNRFIKDEIQRIKAGNPDISHREAFSAAAKNWAHFPHIHFGLMPPHQLPIKKPNICQHEGDEHVIVMKDGFVAAAANVRVYP